MTGRGIVEHPWKLGEWERQAACRDLDPAEADRMFYPEKGHGTSEARQICAGCPVKQKCLELALNLGPVGHHGVWGGTTLRERQMIRRRSA